MLPTTLDLVRTALKTDPTLSIEQRTRLIAALRQAEKPIAPAPATAPTTAPAPQVITRQQAAKMLGRSLRYVDRLAEAQHLRRVKLPGRKRAIGFLESELRGLVSGGPLQEQPAEITTQE